MIIDTKHTVCNIPSRNMAGSLSWLLSWKRGRIFLSLSDFVIKAFFKGEIKSDLTIGQKFKNEILLFKNICDSKMFIHFTSIESSNRSFENDFELHSKVLEVEILE